MYNLLQAFASSVAPEGSPSVAARWRENDSSAVSALQVVEPRRLGMTLNLGAHTSLSSVTGSLYAPTILYYGTWRVVIGWGLAGSL